MILQTQGIYEGVIQAGLRLAETPESEGGWAEYFAETDAGDMRIKDDMLRAQTAILLENAKRWMATKCGARALDEQGRWRINEATRSALVGEFSDHLYPIIRAGFPTNPINDLVSVQPTPRRSATIVYWHWIYGSTKGSYVQGQRVFDANVGKQSSGINYSNEVIDQEAITAIGSAGVTISGTLAYHDGGGVRPTTVRVTATLTTAGAGIVFYDNGQGVFISAGATVSASSINYMTGAWSITISGDTFTTAATNTATYRWDSEGSSMIPEMDVQITMSTVETERRAMKLNYSRESVQDILAELGASLEPQLLNGAAENMNDEVARQLIEEMWAAAPVVTTFPATNPSTEYSQQEHFRDLPFYLNSASNNIQSRTRKGYGNWGVIDQAASNVIESLPAGMFVAAPRGPNVQGLHFIGTLLNKFRIYKDMRLSNATGASATGNFLMGFKGSQFYEAGLVWSPYQLMYTTGTLETADFMNQKGIATRYATKMANPNMYARVNIAA